MNPEQQRIELAKLDGWELRHCKYHGHTSWHSPLGVCAEGSVSEMLPDYLSDLNAVHELEKKLKKNHAEWRAYKKRLFWLPDYGAFATAAQRCEAILKVKGLWR